MTRKIDITLIILLILLALPLRFLHLGYSDYISDEPGTFLFIENPKNYKETYELIMSQRKGPMQLLVGTVPYLFVGNYNNELAQRIPFSLFSTLAIPFVYLFVLRVTKSRLAGFFSAVLVMVNGFIVGFGRISQYQSLNLFFSFGSLYFYSYFLATHINYKKLLKYSLLGTAFFSLSILSHWDAFLIIPVIVLMFIKFLKNHQVSIIFKKKVIVYNGVAGLLILLPFLVPYFYNLLNSTSNQAYFNSRVGFRQDLSHEENLLRFNIYNPFLTFWIYTIFGALGALFIKKTYIFSIWFIFAFIYYTFFVHHAGTHIYNLLLPLAILSGIGLAKVVKAFPVFTQIASLITILFALGFLWIQSYTLFVDHKVEYPWRQDSIFGFETPKYERGEPLRHLLGFPLRRNWKEINEFVNEQNSKNGENLSYITNENRSLSTFYMDSEYKVANSMYLIGVKRPYSFATDYTFPQFKGINTIHKMQNEEGETVVNIYLLRDRGSE